MLLGDFVIIPYYFSQSQTIESVKSSSVILRYFVVTPGPHREIVWPQYKWEGGARAGGSFQANFLCQSAPNIWLSHVEKMARLRRSSCNCKKTAGHCPFILGTCATTVVQNTQRSRWDVLRKLEEVEM